MNEFEKVDVHKLLPQQEPFVMIDRLVHYDPVRTVTALEVRPDNIFADESKDWSNWRHYQFQRDAYSAGG